MSQFVNGDVFAVFVTKFLLDQLVCDLESNRFTSVLRDHRSTLRRKILLGVFYRVFHYTTVGNYKLNDLNKTE